MHPQPHQPEPTYYPDDTVKTRHGIGKVIEAVSSDGSRDYAVRFSDRAPMLLRAADLRPAQVECRE